jgi:YVTN family beta-propeller protein
LNRASVFSLGYALLASLAYPQGPGLGNLIYTNEEIGKPVSIIKSREGHSRVAMHRGYMVLIYSKDGGEGAGGFSFFDVSDPRAPKMVHDEDTPETQDLREAHGWGMRGDIACLQSHTGMQFWDFSDVRNPKKVGSVTLPGISKSDYNTGLWWTHWQGRYVFGGGTGKGIYVVDAEDPTNPKFVKQWGIPNFGGYRIGSAHAIGNLLITTGFDEGPSWISAIDISDPHGPRLISAIPGEASSYSSLVNGDRLVLSARNRPLNAGVVFDISNPAKMTRIGKPSLNDSGGGGYVGFADGHAFVGLPEKFQKIDMSEPDFPVVMTGTSGIEHADNGFVTPMGNIVFIGNDHGTGSALVPHQVGKDLVGPIANMVVPRDGAVNQATASRVGVSFTDMIDGSTLDTSNFTVRPIGGVALEGYFAHQTGIVNFHPKTPLKPNTTYEVVVRQGGLKDYAGNAVPREFRSVFSTGAKILDCQLETSSPVSFRADSIRFSLDCGQKDTVRVAWDFGDGTKLEASRGRTSASHSYSKVGTYNVFAHIQGFVVPVSVSLTIINPPTAKKPTRSSTIILDDARDRLWTVNADNNSVTVLNARTQTKIREVKVGANPRTLALDRFHRVWVVNQDDATLSILDSGGTLIHTLPLPYASRPYGIAFNPSGDTAYVTLEAVGKVLRIKASNYGDLGALDLFRTPRGIAISADGKQAFVSRFISGNETGEVAKIDLSTFSWNKTIPLAYDNTVDNPNGGGGIPNAVASVSISPDGKWAWAPFKKDNVRRGLFADRARAAAPTFESTVRTAVGSINLDTLGEDISRRLDLDNQSLANAVEFDSKGLFAYVTTGASNHTVVVNAVTGKQSTAIEPEDNQNELAPDGLAVGFGDSLLFIHYHMSRQIGIYEISEAGKSNYLPRKALVSTIASERLSPEVLRGKKVFYNASDPRMSRDRYLSCVVCHMDGGSDGRVWDFAHKGEGLRRTVSLVGKGGMADGPLHWSANFDEIQDFEHDIRGSFLGTGFLSYQDFNEGTRNTPLGLSKAGKSADLDALASYLRSLSKARPSPYRRPDGTMTPDALEGERIFNRAEVGCAVCHVPPRYTNSGQSMRGPLGYATLPILPSPASSSVLSPQGFLLHDVGTQKAASGMRMGLPLEGLDTPTLLGAWEGGPYLHDGSAATLMDVLTTANPHDRHGKTSTLSQTEKEQLVAFLQQLEVPPEPVVTGLPRPGRPRSITVLKTGSGYLFQYDSSLKSPVLMILDARGTRVAVLKPSLHLQETPLQFSWDTQRPPGKAIQKGIYYLLLKGRGEQISQALPLGFP